MIEEMAPGEVARNLAALTDQVKDLATEVRNLATVYVPREVFELRMATVTKALADIPILDRRVDELTDDAISRKQVYALITMLALLFAGVGTLVGVFR